MQDSQRIASKMLRSQRYLMLLVFTALVTFLIVTSSSAHTYIKDSKLSKSVGTYVDTAKSWANSQYADSASADTPPLDTNAEDQAEAAKQAEDEANGDGIKYEDSSDEPKQGDAVKEGKESDSDDDVSEDKNKESGSDDMIKESGSDDKIKESGSDDTAGIANPDTDTETTEEKDTAQDVSANAQDVGAME